MNKYNLKQWAIAAGIRAIKTIAQASIGIIGADVASHSFSLQQIILTPLLAGIMSLLTSVVGLPELGSEENIEENKKTIDYIDKNVKINKKDIEKIEKIEKSKEMDEE